MSLYRYTAFDASGKEHEGTVQAANAQEAAKQLASQGLRVRMVKEAQPQAPQPPTQQPQRPVQQPTARPPQTRPQPQQPRPQQPNPNQIIQTPQPAPTRAPSPSQQVVNMPAPAQPKVFRTAAGTDKDRFFLFSQIGSGLRAGINPAEFFGQIAPRTKGVYRDSLKRLGDSAAEGIPMSTVMAQYPDLYPQSVVGAMRAGEVGGFLPEAAEMIAQQAEAALRFKRFFWWISAVVISGLICVPLILVFRIAILAAADRSLSNGGSSSAQGVLSDITQAAWKWIVWPFGPITLIVSIILFILWRFSLASASRPIRHKLGLAWPVFGKRARLENLTIFSWTMSKLAAAGLPHQTAWDLAAASVPNMSMEQKLHEVGRRVSSSEKISDAVHSSELFPPEYAPMIATAEYTGDLPGAMNDLSKASRGEFEAQNNYARLRGGCWGCLATVVTAGFILAVVMYVWYRELPHKFAPEVFGDEPSPQQ